MTTHRLTPPALIATLLMVATVSDPAWSQTGPALQLFVTSDQCMGCHNGLVTPAGEDISFGTDWRASMMANAARDPYWQASVRRETLAHPSVADAIQDECSACHMPMMRHEATTAGGMGQVFAYLPINRARTPQQLLAVDGVSCAMCHQIGADHLGEEESFVAGFTVDTTTPLGQREIFGPYEVDAGRRGIMQSASQFVPTQADHIQSSELCATCHTLFTHARGPEGEVVGELPEQVPYLEWRHSDYPERRSCQSCHMPVVEGEMEITGVLGQPRTHVSRHVFRGGNFFMPRIFNAHRAELGVAAQPQELDTTTRRTAQHLETSAARVEIVGATVDTSSGRARLEAEVVLENLAGHKLPTAYPSRRVWIHFVVRDADGRVIFESGALQPTGLIEGNDNDEDRSRYEPHHVVIDEPGKVQIYETVMEDMDGSVTTGLIAAVRFVKDNRIPPTGFDKETAGEDIAVRGAAMGDDDFAAGGDRVRYAVDVSGRQGPFHVQAELWYQPIAFRWAQNLREQDAPEIERFVRYYDQAAGSSGMVLARAAATAQ